VTSYAETATDSTGPLRTSSRPTPKDNPNIGALKTTGRFSSGPSIQDFMLNDSVAMSAVESGCGVLDDQVPPYLSKSDFEGGSRSGMSIC